MRPLSGLFSGYDSNEKSMKFLSSQQQFAE